MKVYFINSFIFMLLILEIVVSLALVFWIIFLNIPPLVFLIPVILYILFATGPMLLDQLE